MKGLLAHVKKLATVGRSRQFISLVVVVLILITLVMYNNVYQHTSTKQFTSSRTKLQNDQILEIRTTTVSTPRGTLNISKLQRFFPEYNFTSKMFPPLCPLHPKGLVADNGITPDSTLPEIIDEAVLNRVGQGGTFEPRDCKARENVAIIVPYRDRLEHLNIFLMHMHTFLQKQYRIYIVELAHPTIFNRGLLSNVGFLIARNTSNHTCYVIHDVDLLPTDERNSYTCSKQPRHLSVKTSKFNFKQLYNIYIGGVAAITQKQFEDANGFSNMFYGWGGEDDDFSYRLSRKGYKLERPPDPVGRYQALRHDADKANAINQNRMRLIEERHKYYHNGLSTIKYTLLSLETRPLYTRIYVNAPKSFIIPLNTSINSSNVG